VQYREYGNTGKVISALGFGAMRLPDDEDYAVEIMQHALDLGVNFIDTAMGYKSGRSEILVGRAVKGRRDRVYLSTKNACRGNEWSDKAWWERMETQLDKLDTDYIDFYCIVHALQWDDFITKFRKPGGGLAAALRAKDEGIIHHIAMSTHDTPENKKKLIDTDIFEGIIVQYNLLNRDNEEVIAHAHQKDMGVCIMGPVAGGRLARRSEQIEDMVGSPVASIPDLALRFVLSNSNVTCAMSGMSTAQMVEENVATASREEPLTSDELESIHKAMQENQELSKLYCTGCGYCLPCPQGVAIPTIFAIMNYHRVWGLTDHARHLYAKLGSDFSGAAWSLGERRGWTLDTSGEEAKMDASACVECGQCEEQCPQNIPIIQQLKECHETLSQ